MKPRLKAALWFAANVLGGYVVVLLAVMLVLSVLLLVWAKRHGWW